jgi:UDP-N-acetylmuramate: L-alanyl-gamma-D-glutamyl-meso-diaminopimelate ligase
VPVAAGIGALSRFRGVKRRMELRGTACGVRVYDDFAHHPTAFATTIAGLRARASSGRVVAVFEPRSNTMKLGAMQDRLAESVTGADLVYCYARDLGWDPARALAPLGARASVHGDLDAMADAIAAAVRPGDHVLVMSNGSFGGIHERLLARLAARPASAAAD